MMPSEAAEGVTGAEETALETFDDRAVEAEMFNICLIRR
jgi:hypothetical protein